MFHSAPIRILYSASLSLLSAGRVRVTEHHNRLELDGHVRVRNCCFVVIWIAKQDIRTIRGCTHLITARYIFFITVPLVFFAREEGGQKRGLAARRLDYLCYDVYFYNISTTYAFVIRGGRSATWSAATIASSSLYFLIKELTSGICCTFHFFL